MADRPWQSRHGWPVSANLMELVPGNSPDALELMAEQRMQEPLNREMLVHFSLELYLNRTSDLYAALHLTMKGGQDKEKAALAMIKQLALRELITYNFGDRPEQFIVVFWSPSIGDLNETIADLEKSGTFEEVCPNLILDARYYEGARAMTPPMQGKTPK